MRQPQPAMSKLKPQTVGILIFNDVEVLDFCGPYEVFAATTLSQQEPAKEGIKPFDVLTIAEHDTAIRCRGGMVVLPSCSIEDHPPLDILVVPGGRGVRRELDNPPILNWIAVQHGRAGVTISVCTGAFLLAARGLLDGVEATTHSSAIELLHQKHPAVLVRKGLRYVDHGSIITSAGVSASIDAALHVVSRFHGEYIAQQTAREMEYQYPASLAL